MIVNILTSTGNKYTFWGVSRWSILFALFCRNPTILGGKVSDKVPQNL